MSYDERATTATGGEPSRPTLGRILAAIEADTRAHYRSGYSDGYDAGIADAGAHVPAWLGIVVWIWGVVIGAACAWAWL